jgi:hypothetical protein
LEGSGICDSEVQNREYSVEEERKKDKVTATDLKMNNTRTRVSFSFDFEEIPKRESV